MKRLMVLALGLMSLSGCYAGYYGPRHYRRGYVVAPARVYVAPPPAVVVRAY